MHDRDPEGPGRGLGTAELSDLLAGVGVLVAALASAAAILLRMIRSV
jgi:hypothetical protein